MGIRNSLADMSSVEENINMELRSSTEVLWYTNGRTRIWWPFTLTDWHAWVSDAAIKNGIKPSINHNKTFVKFKITNFRAAYWKSKSLNMYTNPAKAYAKFITIRKDTGRATWLFKRLRCLRNCRISWKKYNDYKLITFILTQKNITRIQSNESIECNRSFWDSVKRCTFNK